MRGRWPALLVAVAAAACAYREPPPGSAGAGLTLPPGDGRAILERECLNCHELEAIGLFSDFYGRERWRALVITMRDNGATVDDAEVEILAAYLAQHFGTGAD